jgi:hypothetical protein
VVVVREDPDEPLEIGADQIGLGFGVFRLDSEFSLFVIDVCKKYERVSQ